MYRRGLGLACAGALALALPAAAQPQPGARQDACFFQRDVQGFSAAGSQTVYLRVGVNDYYRLDLDGPCDNLDFALGLGLRNRSGGPTICSPLDAEVIVRLSGAPTDYCPVKAIRKLTPAEAAALGKSKP